MRVGSAEWLKVRQTGLGGTDSAALAGVGFLGAADVYRQKTEVEPVDRQPTERMRLGVALEPEVAARYAHVTGSGDLRLAPSIVRHPTVPHLLCSPDRFNKGRMVELKCVFGPASGEWGEPGSDEIPSGYLCQVQHDMEVCRAAGLTNEDIADVGVLFVGWEFRVYRVASNARLWEMLMDLGDSFWTNHVTPRIEPIDWEHPLQKEIGKQVLSVRDAEAVQLDAEALKILEEYEHFDSLSKEYELEARSRKEQILTMVGEAGSGRFPDGSVVRRRVIQRKAYTVEATSYVDSRFRRPRRK